MSLLSAAAAAFYDSINAATSPDQLGNLSRAIRHNWGRGEIADDDAQFLSEAIERRKPQRRVPATVFGKLNGRLWRFAPRSWRKRLTDEERIERRRRKRMLGGSSAMPDTLRGHYSEGERAVGCVVAGEIKRTGECKLSIDEIADRAGVRRTTVQNFQHEARRLGHIHVRHRPQSGAKSLTNVITIVSSEWLTWVKRAPSAARSPHRVQISKNVNTTKNIDFEKERGLQGNAEQPPPRLTG
jgi:hypothetical protein